MFLPHLCATAGLAIAFSGCATALSSFSPAHVPPKGHVHAEAGFDVSVPTGTITQTIDSGKALAASAASRTLTEQERQQVFDAGVNLALNPPALLQHFGIAYAPVERTELSLRSVGGGWRFGGRYQLWVQGVDRGWDLTVGLGAARQSFAFPVDNVLDILTIDDFRRYAFDLPIVFGRRGRWYRLWGGPRLLATTGSSQMRLNLPASGQGSAETVLAAVDSSGFYYGAQTGFALGYEKVFLGIELNLVKFNGQADVTVGATARTVSLDTFVVYPGIALMGEF